MIAYLSAIATAAIFSIHYAVVARFGKSLDYMALGAWRGLTGGTILLALAHWKNPSLWVRVRHQWKNLLVISFFGFACNQYLMLKGIRLSPPTLPAIIANVLPFLLYALGLVIGAERWHIKRSFGLAVGFAAVFCVFDATSWTFNGASQNYKGPLYCFLSMTSLAVALTEGKKLMAHFSSLEIAAFTLSLGGGMLAIGANRTMPEVLSIASESGTNLCYFLFEVLISTIGGYGCNFFALRRLPASTVGYFNFFQPIFSAAIAWILNGWVVNWEWLGIMGGLLVGAYLVISSEKVGKS